MKIIIDTNVIINGIFFDDEYPECWDILYKIRQEKVVPLISVDVVREYMYAPFSALMNIAKNNLQNKELTVESLDDLQQIFYHYSAVVSKLLMINAEQIKVNTVYTTLTDNEDNKFVSLAIDSNCNIIITHNISDFQYVKSNDVFTKDGQKILIMHPDEFLDYFSKQNRRK